jgi:hypothetical protein
MPRSLSGELLFKFPLGQGISGSLTFVQSLFEMKSNNSTGRRWEPNLGMETPVDTPPGDLRMTITRLFTKSIELGYYPDQWKRARIVVLRKAGKPDYSVPGAYRPISLLNT